jgi:hypothetical protein
VQSQVAIKRTFTAALFALLTVTSTTPADNSGNMSTASSGDYSQQHQGQKINTDAP